MEDSWKYILEFFRITPPSQQTIFYSWIVLLCIVIIVSIIQIILHFRRKKQRFQREWYLFNKLAEARDLSDLEAEVLIRLAQKYSPETPQGVVESVSKYDRFVKDFMASFQQWDAEIDREEAQDSFETTREKFFHRYFDPSDEIKTTRSIPHAQNIRITIPAEFGNRHINVFVEENTTENFTLISDDYKDLHFVFQKGEKFEGYFWRQGDAGYRFPLTVKDQIDKHTVVFEHTNKISRKQRRHFYRINARLTGRFYKLNPEEKQGLIENKVFKRTSRPGNFLGTVVSISGGGISFFTENPSLETDDILRIELLLRPKEKLTDIFGRIVRVKDLERRYKIFVEFIMVSDQNREEIIKYVSNIQRNWKKDNGGAR